MIEDKKLIGYAIKAKEKSYSPYSNFKVGAAVLTEEGKVFTGCNIENAAYSPTICAERTAIAKAVSEGYRSFTKIAIVGGDEGAFPCGVCRQFIKEFSDDMVFLIAKSTGEYEEYTLEEVLPNGFGPRDLD